LAAGDSFSFPVTWDLTDAEIKNNPNASSGSISPGIKSAPLTLYTTNGAVGYATMFPISLTGTEVSTAPFLTLAPKTVDYGGIVILNNTAIPTQSGIITISNAGLSPLTILGYGYTNDELIGSNPPNFTNSTLTNGIWDLGLGLTGRTPKTFSIIRLW
jgi:iron transport multicopper oxidase